MIHVVPSSGCHALCCDNLVVVEVKAIVDVVTVTGVKMLAEMRISVTGTTVLMGEVD